MLKKPILTEKTMQLASRGVFTFEVDAQADKRRIAGSVAGMYKVSVREVRTVIMHGKPRRTGKRRSVIRKPDWKKAFVRLADGQTIDAFQIGQADEKK